MRGNRAGRPCRAGCVAVGQAGGQRASGHGLRTGPALPCSLRGDVGAPAGHGELPTPCAAQNPPQPLSAETTATAQAPTPTAVATAPRSTGRRAPSTQVAVGTLAVWVQDGAIEPLASPPAPHGAGADAAAPGAGTVLLTASPVAAGPGALPAAKRSREDGGHPPRAASMPARVPRPGHQRHLCRRVSIGLSRGSGQQSRARRAPGGTGTAGTSPPTCGAGRRGRSRAPSPPRGGDPPVLSQLCPCAKQPGQPPGTGSFVEAKGSGWLETGHFVELFFPLGGDEGAPWLHLSLQRCCKDP